jgi:hypothetical protein
VSRLWLERIESSAEGDEALALLAWLGGAGVAVPEPEARGAVRRAMLLLAAGGDPRRALDLEGRAVTALAAELDRAERRTALALGLEALRAEASGLAATEAALARLLGDPDLAWRAYAAGLLGEELADD